MFNWQLSTLRGLFNSKMNCKNCEKRYHLWRISIFEFLILYNFWLDFSHPISSLPLVEDYGNKNLSFFGILLPGRCQNMLTILFFCLTFPDFEQKQLADAVKTAFPDEHFEQFFERILKIFNLIPALSKKNDVPKNNFYVSRSNTFSKNL